MLQVLANISLESFLDHRKGGMWLCKKKSIGKKWTSVQSRIRGKSPPKKGKNKIAHTLWESLNKRTYFMEHSKIRISHHISHTYSTHMHILTWLYDLTLFGFIVWLYNKCLASMYVLSPYPWAPYKL